MDIELNEFYSRLIAIGIIIGLGFLLGKVRWIDEGTNKNLVNMLLMVFMPAALFSAFPSSYSEESLAVFLAGLLGGAIVMLALIMGSKILFGKWLFKGKLRYEAQFAFIFNNATFLGYPIIASTFGEEGLVPYSGFIIAFNLALFSYGVFLFERKLTTRLVKDVILNPNVIAVLFGLVLFLLNWQMPAPVMDSVEFVAGAMTPLSLICIGYMLSHAKLVQMIRKWRLFAVAAAQLTLGPTLTYWLLRGLGFPTEVVMVCTLIQALPTATSLGLFAKKYGGNDIESSELVAISTVMSVVTLPVMVTVLLG